MPFWILAPTVVVSLVLVVGLTWVVGWSAAARLDAQLARARFATDYPGVPIEHVTVTQDAAAAIVRFGRGGGLEGGTAVVFAVGDRFAIRLLRDAQLEPRSDGVIVRFADFGVPRLHLTGPTAQLQDALRA